MFARLARRFERKRFEVYLFQNFGDDLTLFDALLRCFIDVGGELNEGLEFAELSELDAELASNFLHGFRLRG